MDKIALKDIKLDWQPESIANENNIKLDTAFGKKFLDLLLTSERIMQPRALLRWVSVDCVEDEYTTIEGFTFKSKVMATQLQDCEKVFVAALTSGHELKSALGAKNVMIADMMQTTLLNKLQNYVEKYIKENFNYNGIGFITPGSLPDWPIHNNKTIFALLENVEEDIGVSLNKYGYMDPHHSLSGIFFPTTKGYQNCSLCKIFDCPNRRAAFNKREYDNIFG